jgi:hypothetical protein
MPTGIYQSKNRRGGQKGRSGVYPKTKEHRDKIRETLKKKGIKPPVLWGNKNMLGKHHSRETKLKISLAQKGREVSEGTRLKIGFKKEKHWHWKEDRSQLVKSEKKHLDGRYREWMLVVKQRDNWECKINNSDCNGRLESHHILNWKDYPELRYEINNGITLCHAHHPRKREDEAERVSLFRSLISEVK